MTSFKKQFETNGGAMHPTDVPDKDTYNVRERKQNPVEYVTHHLGYIYGCWCYGKSLALNLMALSVASCCRHAVVGRPFRVGNKKSALVETIKCRLLKVNLTLAPMESVAATVNTKVWKYGSLGLVAYQENQAGRTIRLC
ncbi:hypothetical protein ACHAP8_005711 [Fusarium lateritium]|nr:unnamed protein product [Fusarium graminearum]